MSYGYGESSFPWIKLIIISVPLSILMLWMAPTLKWKLLFVPCVWIGAAIALSGRSINLHKGRGRR